MINRAKLNEKVVEHIKFQHDNNGINIPTTDDSQFDVLEVLQEAASKFWEFLGS